MKRAQLFDIGMVLVVVGAMIGIMLVVNTIANETSAWKSMSKRAFELQNSYSEADHFVQFMAASARWASGEVVLSLASNGGFAQDSPCGKVNDVQLWNSRDAKTACLPNAYESFYALLSKKLEAYSRLYAGIPPMPYDFLITGNRLLAISAMPLRLNIMAPKETYVHYEPTDLFGIWTSVYEHPAHAAGTYVFRPNFEIPFAYNLDSYGWLTRASSGILSRCGLKASRSEKEECIKFELGSLSGVSVSGSADGLFIISVAQDYNNIYTNSQPPVIKFGLYVPESAPVPEPLETV